MLTGAGVSLLSIAWFSVATFVVIPRHAAPVYGDAASVYFQRYGELGSGLGDILRTLVSHPGLVWRTVVEPLRLRYLASLLAPAGFLSLLAPEILLLGAPLLIANILSSYAAQYSGAFHYSAPLVPYIVIAGVVGASRLVGWLRARTALGTRLRPRPLVLGLAVVSWVLAWSIGWQVQYGYTPMGQRFRWPEVTEHHRLLDRFTAQVPQGLPGSATAALYPHLSHREKLYLFPTVADARWVLLDVSGTTDMHPVSLRDQVLRMIDGGQWGVLDAADGYLLLAQGQGDSHIPDSFYDFVRPDRPQPQHRANLAFTPPAGSGQEGTLRLLGYDVVDDDTWRLTAVRCYWQASGSLPPNLRPYPFFVVQDGTIVEDTAERPPVALVWYPPSRWSGAEALVVETLPWYLPRHWGLGIGLTQGDAWAQRDDRWHTAEGDVSQVFDNGTWALVGLFQRQNGLLQPLVDDPVDQPAVPLSADFGGQLQLLGHEGLPESVRAGGILQVQFIWQATRRPELDYSVFLHLRDASNSTAAQWDGQPTWYGEQPTASWQPEDLVKSAHSLHLADDSVPGQYRLVMGIYDWRTADRLPLLDRAEQPTGNELELGAVSVLPAAPEAATGDLCCALTPECCVSAEQP
jgi:hypothetical protein